MLGLSSTRRLLEDRRLEVSGLLWESRVSGVELMARPLSGVIGVSVVFG